MDVISEEQLDTLKSKCLECFDDDESTGVPSSRKDLSKVIDNIFPNPLETSHPLSLLGVYCFDCLTYDKKSPSISERIDKYRSDNNSP